MTDREIISELTRRGFRITHIREKIIECLSDGKESHSFFDLMKHLNRDNEKLNKSSIYNTLDLLINEGFIHAYISGNSRNIYYKLINNNIFYITLRECCTKKDIETKILDKDIVDLIINRYDIQDLTNIRVEIIKK